MVAELDMRSRDGKTFTLLIFAFQNSVLVDTIGLFRVAQWISASIS